MTVKFVIIKLCNKECNAMLYNKEFCKKKTLHCIGQVQKDVQRERERESMKDFCQFFSNFHTTQI